MVIVELEQKRSFDKIPGFVKLLGAMGTGLLIGGLGGPGGAIIGGAVGGTIYLAERIIRKVDKFTEKLADDYTSQIRNL
jgi:hypothetical protein